jgi:hypothetical protein
MGFHRPGIVLVSVWLAGAGVCLGDAASLPQKDAPAAASGLFDDFDDAKEYPSAETLRGLLVQTPGEPYEIAEARKWEKPIRRISGLLRMNSPWSTGSALRLSILDPQQFQLHLFSGTQGVTLRYYPEYHQTWGAYGTTREAGKPRPAEFALWATSEDYYRRCGVGTVELHVQGGRLFLVRGDLMLLSVPMESPPSEVYFEGVGLVRGLAWVESKWTPEPIPVRPAVLTSDRPAELAWEFKPAEGIALNRIAEGRIELAAGEKAQPCQALTPLGDAGIHEFTFEVEDADAGTGVSLADAEGKPICRVGFFRHRESGKRVFDLLPPWANDLERGYDVNRQPVPYAGKRQWLRVVSGAGIFKLFTSGDGVAWRQPAVLSPGFEGACVKVGLFCLAAPQKRSIKLRSLSIRKLNGLYAAVSGAVLAGVAPIPKKLDKPEDWQAWATESRPADVAASVWWRACVLRTLAAGVKPQLAQPLLTRLQETVLDESPGLEVDRLVQFMQDSVLLYASDDWASIDRLAPEARRFGSALVRRGHPTPFTAASRAMIRWPIWPPRRLAVFPDDLLRHELFLHAGQDRNDQTREFCRQVRYWNRSGGPRESDQPVSLQGEYLIQWADPTLGSAAGAIGRGRRPPRAPTYQAAHPLVEQIGKEGFNTVSEIRAAIDGQAFREACQIVASLAGPASLGLVPDSDDPRLLLSFPLAVAAEMRSCPEFGKTMQVEFSKIGQLRLKQAVAGGDDAAVESVVAQFPGTQVVAEAHRWLGDRRLASGRFAEAAGYYRRAVLVLPDAEREALVARYRLTGALLGRDWGRPVQSPVQLGGTSFSAAEFEQMIGGLKQTRRSPAAVASGEGGPGDEAASGAFVPGRYELRPWANVEGRSLKRPSVFPDKGIDWVGRQTAVLPTPRQLIVNNRAELVAFDLDTGKPRWSQQVESAEQYQQWPLVPMRPVAFGERILVRRLTADGAELACLDAGDGRLLWTSKPETYVASDPVVVDGKPLALCASHEGTGKISLLLVEFSAASGRVRSRVPLAEFRQWQRRPLDCQVTLAEDRLIASMAGCVLACSPAGRVCWIRRQVWVPPPGLDYQNVREWCEQHHEPLHMAGGRVYATQPGVWGIECLELESGRLLWRQGAGNLTRLAGRAGDRLILETSDGPAALDPETGKLLWTRQVKHCLATRICSPTGAVLSVAVHVGRKATRENPSGIVLSWFEPKEGAVLGSAVLEMPAQGGWHVGPVVAASGRQWLAMAPQQQPAQRQVMEAIRTGNAETSDAR